MMINIRISPNVPWSLFATIYLAILVATNIGKCAPSYPIYRSNVLSARVLAYAVSAVVVCLSVLIIQGSLSGLKIGPHPVPGNASSVLSAVVVVFLPQLGAFYEELAFRGVLQGGLHPILDWRVAFVFSTILFCVLHAPNAGFAQSWLALLLLSGACGLIAVRTRCLLPGMLIHAGYNLAVTMTTFTWGVIDLGALKTIVLIPTVVAITLIALAAVLFKSVPQQQMIQSKC
jgi:membrane protease YdiL (CAAX protease family)